MSTKKIVPIPTEVFERFLVHVGCELESSSGGVKRKGGHKKYTRAGLLRPIIVQAKPEVPVFIIKNNLRVLGISNIDYLNLLEQLGK